MSETDVKAISRRRGVTSEFNTFTTGLVAEVTVNTTNNSVVVSDGNGTNYEASRADLSNVDKFDVLKKGIADNDLSNTTINYTIDVNGVVYKNKKTADQLKQQLTNAYIADKDLSNVPLNIILNKGVAKVHLENVPQSALSWDDPNFSERIGYYTGVDVTGGGYVQRNLLNMKTETFDNIPTVSASLTGSGLAYKTLKNVGRLEASVMLTMGIANISLTNVTDNDFYGKEVVSEATDKGKYVLKRDLTNVDGDHISIDSLTRGKIASIDLNNIQINDVDRPSIQDRLGVPDYNLRGVEREVLTDTSDSGNFKLMSYDASNADKDKVFKGQKNLLLNGDFSVKNTFFTETGDMDSNEMANIGDSFYACWTAYENGSKISVTSGVANMQGKWGQTILWNDEFESISSLYFSVDMEESSPNCWIYLCQPLGGNYVTKVSQQIFSSDTHFGRYYVELDLTSVDLVKNVPLILMVGSDPTTHESFSLKELQLERFNVSNFEKCSQSVVESLCGYKSKKVVMLTILDNAYYALENFFQVSSQFSSDPIDKYYVRESDVRYETGDYIPYAIAVYRYIGDKLTFYTNSANKQFAFDYQGDQKISIRTSLYGTGDLVYSKETKKIYTFVRDNFYLLNDPNPLRGPLYLDLYPNRESLYLWDDVQKDFISISGDSAAKTTLPLFMHILSDRKLESSYWAESDSFSKKNANIYTDAYNYLVNQVHPQGTMIAGGSYTTSSNQSYLEQVGREATWLIEWSDNKIEDTGVLLNLDMSTALTQVKEYLNTKGYSYNTGAASIYNLRVSRELVELEENNIHYYKTFDGLKVVLETQENLDAIEARYNSTGDGWYYLLYENSSLDESHFRLPRLRGYSIDGDDLDSPVGEIYATNVVITTASSANLSVLNKKLYFYMGYPKFSNEEVAVNNVFGFISQLDRKLDCSINDSTELEEEIVNGNSVFVLDISNRIHDYIIRPTTSTALVKLNLNPVLGDTDPVITRDPETQRIINIQYPYGVYDQSTQFDFNLIVDKRYAPNNAVTVSMTNENRSSEAIYVPDVNDTVSHQIVYEVSSYIAGDYMNTDLVKREMYQFFVTSEDKVPPRSLTADNATLASALNIGGSSVKFVVVSALPSNPDANTIYFIPE